MNYYSGTVSIFFYDVEAPDQEELEEKIYKYIDRNLPQWANVDGIDIDNIATEPEPEDNYGN